MSSYKVNTIISKLGEFSANELEVFELCCELDESELSGISADQIDQLSMLGHDDKYLDALGVVVRWIAWSTVDENRLTWLSMFLRNAQSLGHCVNVILALDYALKKAEFEMLLIENKYVLMNLYESAPEHSRDKVVGSFMKFFA